MAKRVTKWKKSTVVENKYTAKLAGGHCLMVTLISGRWDTLVCKSSGNIEFGSYKTLEAAQRYCIREAKKLHKLVGTQLTEHERVGK